MKVCKHPKLKAESSLGHIHADSIQLQCHVARDCDWMCLIWIVEGDSAPVRPQLNDALEVAIICHPENKGFGIRRA